MNVVDEKKKREQEEMRKRQLAILKASNQLLKESLDKALLLETDELEKQNLIDKFNQAIDENKFKAKTYLNSTGEDIDNATFREVSQSYVDKYNKMLEKRGMTDEEMHRKSSATVSTKKSEKNGIPRRKRKGSKSYKEEIAEEIERLSNEKELMEQTLVKSDEDIKRNIERNTEIEQEELKRKNNALDKAVDEIVDSSKKEKINVDSHKEEKVVVDLTNEGVENREKKNTPKKKREEVKYDFDFNSIPSYVQYDVLPLPSEGQCYPIDSPLRCGRIAVSYLTAADENIIVSPNLYRDGKLLDVILERKILDKRIKASDLCTGDRDAIILWLRATSYGTDFPIVTRNPETGKQYDVVINLSDFKYFDFNLEGDENGLFEYITKNGDVIKFKMLTKEDEDELKNNITNQVSDTNSIDILKNVGYIKSCLENVKLNEEELNNITEDLGEISEIIGSNMDDINEDGIYSNSITEQMLKHTMSINGDTDREHIRMYIENMRAFESLNYRNYFRDNKPGVDFTLTIDIPESDGGGSFTTFLRFDDTVFINY